MLHNIENTQTQAEFSYRVLQTFLLLPILGFITLQIVKLESKC